MFLYFFKIYFLKNIEILSGSFVGPLNPRAVRTDLDGWVYTQRAGPEARSAGLQTLPRGSALTPKAWQAPC